MEETHIVVSLDADEYIDAEKVIYDPTVQRDSEQLQEQFDFNSGFWVALTIEQAQKLRDLLDGALDSEGRRL